MKQYGLIGFPLGHSFSASYFGEKFSKEGIEAVYKNFPLKNIDEFKELVKNEPGLMGLNVTVPYKEKVIPFLDGLSQTSRIIQAVNTICFCRRNDRLALTGHNTDVIGFERSLKDHLKSHHTSALVLGTGGSSKAVIFVLKELGIDFKKVSRSRGEDRILYSDLDGKQLKDHTIIINTSPLGMHPDVETYPDIPYNLVTPDHLLFDLVYNPEKSAFLSRGETMGAAIVNGHNMLHYQAKLHGKYGTGKSRLMANTFQKEFIISSYDLNPLGKARLTTIANFLQEMAYTHALQLGFGYDDMKQKQTMWVLSRMKIRINRYPGWNDTIRIETWHRGMSRIFGLRDFRVEDTAGNVTGIATTNWLVIDTQTKRPVRPKDDVLNEHGNDESVFEKDLEKIHFPAGMDLLDQRKVVYSDLDIVGHVNNVKYMEWCIDAATADNSEIREIRELEINFMHEAHFGDEIEISTAPVSEEESLFAARRIGDDQEIFRARLVWDQAVH